jgi:hypothetical protein
MVVLMAHSKSSIRVHDLSWQYPLSHQLLKICGRYDTRDKKIIAIIDNLSVIYIYIYIRRSSH